MTTWHSPWELRQKLGNQFRTNLNPNLSLFNMPISYLILRLLLVLLCHIATIWTSSARAATARLLIYSATQRFRHDSIPTAITVLKEHGPSIDAIFDATEDASQFNDANLAKYDALIFLSTTGEGDHSSSFTLETWPQPCWSPPKWHGLPTIY